MRPRYTLGEGGPLKFRTISGFAYGAQKRDFVAKPHLSLVVVLTFRWPSILFPSDGLRGLQYK